MPTAHPLDPLRAEGSRRGRGGAGQRGVNDRWRLASIELGEPFEGSLKRRGPQLRPRAKPRSCAGTARRRRLQGGVARLRSRRLVGGAARRAAADDADEFHECDAVAARPPRRDRGARRTRHHRHGPASCSTSGRTARSWSPSATGAGGSAGPTSGAATPPQANPYANMSAGCTRSSTSTRWSCSSSRTRDPGPAPRHGRVRPAARPRSRPRHDLKPLEITQPDGPSFTLDGNQLALAEVVDAARLQLPRGSRDPRRRLRR